MRVVPLIFSYACQGGEKDWRCHFPATLFTLPCKPVSILSFLCIRWGKGGLLISQNVKAFCLGVIEDHDGMLTVDAGLETICRLLQRSVVNYTSGYQEPIQTASNIIQDPATYSWLASLVKVLLRTRENRHAAA
ncbi:hypothetical protein ACRALDRAFT_210856 [Sodiomyces alcalophilus JCM 7366]|uniref:uncharacterized protein n=1 Tax=Sodiomyces alcalophilus JCM 7366 TaxID=591952 RepID=UPI0039B678AA